MSFLIIKSGKAETWAEDNLITESWQHERNTIAIDHHYVDDIIDGMINDGLQPNIDFSLF